MKIPCKCRVSNNPLNARLIYVQGPVVLHQQEKCWIPEGSLLNTKIYSVSSVIRDLVWSLTEQMTPFRWRHLAVYEATPGVECTPRTKVMLLLNSHVQILSTSSTVLNAERIIYLYTFLWVNYFICSIFLVRKPEDIFCRGSTPKFIKLHILQNGTH